MQISYGDPIEIEKERKAKLRAKHMCVFWGIVFLLCVGYLMKMA